MQRLYRPNYSLNLHFSARIYVKVINMPPHSICPKSGIGAKNEHFRLKQQKTDIQPLFNSKKQPLILYQKERE